MPLDVFVSAQPILALDGAPQPEGPLVLAFLVPRRSWTCLTRAGGGAVPLVLLLLLLLLLLLSLLFEGAGVAPLSTSSCQLPLRLQEQLLGAVPL